MDKTSLKERMSKILVVSLLSITLHLVIIFAMSLMPGRQDEEISEVVTITVFEEAEEEVEEVEEIEKLEVETVEIEVSVDVDVDIETEAVEMEDILDVVEEDVEEFEDLAVFEDLEVANDDQFMSEIATLGLSASADFGSAGIVSGRMSAGSRAKAAGGARTHLVSKALEWLAAQQKSNGQWSGSHLNAISGAAALAFLGNGNSTKSGPHKEVVQRFVNHYLENEPKDSGHGNHGHATPFVIMAMCDALVMDPLNKELKAYCERAIAYVCKTQLNNGGWSGGGAPAALTSKEIDIAQSAWFVMSLVSARFADVDFPIEHMRRAKSVMMKLANGTFDGEIKVTSHGGQDDYFDRDYALSAYLPTLLIFLGESPKSPWVKKHMDRALSEMPGENKRNYWLNYNLGLGVFQAGRSSSAFRRFEKNFINGLSKSIKKDKAGPFWSNEHIYKKGGKSDTSASVRYWGNSGATAMAILNLQVFYRYGNVSQAFGGL